MNETETHETIMTTTTTGTVPIAEVPRPVTAAEEFIQARGTFAVGEETTPAQDAADRQHRGSFAPEAVTTIEFNSPDGRKLSRFGTLIVNRDLTDWIAFASRAHVPPPSTLPDLEVRDLEVGFTSRPRAR